MYLFIYMFEIALFYCPMFYTESSLNHYVYLLVNGTIRSADIYIKYWCIIFIDIVKHSGASQNSLCS